ncbi:serine hydrolase domain-containing protein [Erythrobacter sp. NE805]|uniref:serine hydrolase domain-containing protein n=1 Tax=Erythrobacter sp. NE805 TaxID=3389875 RepID=UPI00396B406F
MRWMASVMAGVLLLGSGLAAFAQTPAAPLAAGRIEAAFDRMFGPRGTVRHTGAVIAVVENGRIVTLKAYGHADAAGKLPVDPARTRFRTGSITKTLVGVAVAQAMTDGRIRSLDDPVNAYLTRWKVPDNRGTPITIRMLATHQAGFAERRQPFMRAGDRFPAIDAAYLDANLPGYIVAANTGSNYSNFGAGLLGFMAEDAAKMPIDRYLAARVFGPARMAHALVARGPEPIPDAAQAEVIYPNGGTRPLPDTWSNHPINRMAGGLAMTGEDAAHYMIALLGGSPSLGIADILGERGRALAFARQGGTHPAVQGYGLLFMINDWNGTRLAEHGGRTIGTSSYMTLLPDRKTGIFVAVTGEGGTTMPLAGLLGLPAAPRPDAAEAGRPLPTLSGIRAAGVEALLGRWQAPPAVGTSARDLAPYAGDYISQRRQIRSVSEIFSANVLGGPLPVGVGSDGALQLGSSKGFKPHGANVFWRSEALQPDKPSGWSDVIVFLPDTEGKPTRASLQYTDAVYHKAEGLARPALWNRALAIGVLVLLTGVLALAWAKGSRGRWLAAGMPLALLASPVLFFRSWAAAPVEPLQYVQTTSMDLVPFQIWMNLVAAGVLGLLVLAALSVREPATAGWRGGLARWHLRLLGLGAIPLLFAFWSYGLIGWNVG